MTISSLLLEGVYRSIANEGVDRSVSDIEAYLNDTASSLSPLFKQEWSSYSPEEKRKNIRQVLRDLCLKGQIDELPGDNYRARESW